MKKLLLVLAIGAFVACNNSGGDTNAADTATKPVDTPTVITPDTTTNPVDTTAKPDTTKK